MANSDKHIEVLITSIDGNTTHQFRADQTVDDVRRFGYDKLVKDKAQVPFENTWIELGDTRLEGGVILSSLVKPHEKEKKDDPDLSVSLVWTQQGGASQEPSQCSILTEN